MLKHNIEISVWILNYINFEPPVVVVLQITLEVNKYT